ncbi:hypothetical protein FGO68_gene104 [Halteria grandinella]|uniref:Phosphoribosyltransferase domain-containing protein n=1 Tax=Halteria grandinella TaxID=5974 RepID=A0A8J8NK96_HALGN|nr:hypothetical protein FGO68_gene104 [Halteria grandinella]
MVEQSYPVQKEWNAINIPDGTRFEKDHFPLSRNYKAYIDYVLISEGFLRDRIDRMAQNIYAEYRDKGQLDILVIMNSAFKFFTDLLSAINKLSEGDFAKGDEERLKIRVRYCKITTQHLNLGVVDIEKIHVPVTKEEIIGKNILVVEDIFDSGSTIIKTRDVLKEYEPGTLKFAILFHKKNLKNLKHNFFGDFVGFIIPDVFVIGYGMDYNEYYRDLNHLCVINQEGIEHFKQ